MCKNPHAYTVDMAFVKYVYMCMYINNVDVKF